ncbi:MAG: hypothetical protein ACPGSM_11640 [Thiolinea sp.]
MKQLIISTMALILLSTAMVGIASNKDNTQEAQDKLQTVQQTSAMDSLKNAFKFGLKAGWQKDGE